MVGRTKGGVGWGGTVWRRFETRSDKHDLIMRCRVAASLGAFFATLQLLGAPFNIILNWTAGTLNRKGTECSLRKAQEGESTKKIMHEDCIPFKLLLKLMKTEAMKSYDNARANAWLYSFYTTFETYENRSYEKAKKKRWRCARAYVWRQRRRCQLSQDKLHCLGGVFDILVDDHHHHHYDDHHHKSFIN